MPRSGSRTPASTASRRSGRCPSAAWLAALRWARWPTRRRGDVILDDIACTKELDKSSPKLAESICNGKIFPKVDIHFTASTTDEGRVTYYAYELKNVMITSYDISGSGQSDEVPTENVTLNFEEIKVTYTEVGSTGKSTGNVEYSWKVEEAES